MPIYGHQVRCEGDKQPVYQKQKIAKFLNPKNTPNYVIENKLTFGDLFVSGITFGIYTPTTTKYYVPKSTSNIVVSKKKKWSKAYKGYLKD